MNNKSTELIFILDRSGSMAGLETDTIGGYNSMLAKQKEAEGDVIVTTVLFNHDYELLHDRINVKEIEPIAKNEFEVSGTTALLDAIGHTINNMKKVQNATINEHQAEKVLFVITTDGLENASCEYDGKKIRQMIKQQKEEGWEFIFLGANIDAIGTAGQLGIDSDYAVNFHADEDGVQMNFSVVTETVLNYRNEGKIKKGWKKEIEADYKRRK